MRFERESWEYLFGYLDLGKWGRELVLRGQCEMRQEIKNGKRWWWSRQSRPSPNLLELKSLPLNVRGCRDHLPGRQKKQKRVIVGEVGGGEEYRKGEG